MTLPTTPELNKAFEYLRTSFPAVKGKILFFDLSLPNFTPEEFASGKAIIDSKVVGYAISEKRPYAVISHLEEDEFATFSFHGVTFLLEVNLETDKIILYEEVPTDEDFEVIRKQLIQLKEYLSKPKAS